MQIVNLSPGWTLVLCLILWPTIQVAAALLCLKIKDKNLNYSDFFFRTHRCEKEGRIYRNIFFVHKWKHLLPDGGAATKNGFKKKKMTSFSTGFMEKFIVESCRAELSHWISILPFWVFGFFGPPRIMLYMLAYAIFMNAPCIIVQRYNRPRISQLISKIEKK